MEMVAFIFEILPLMIEFQTSMGSLSFLGFSRTASLDGLQPRALALDCSTVRSLADCARQCQTLQWCNSFAFNDVTGACSRQNDALARASRVSLEPGWRHFELTQGTLCPTHPAYVADRRAGTCYRFSSNIMTWDEARQQCQSQGEDLAVLEPLEKAQFVMGHLNDNKAASGNVTAKDDVFVGGIRDSSTNGSKFRWVSGQLVNLTATATLWEDDSYTIMKPVIALSVNSQYQLKPAYSSVDKFYLCERPFKSSP